MVTYDLGSITDWLSAIGTVGAVIVALYLARSDRKPKAKVYARFSYLIGMGSLPDEPFQITVGIVNLGSFPIYLNECTVKLGKDKLAFKDGSHNVKKLLQAGEYYEHSLDYNTIIKGLIYKKLTKVRTYIYFRDASGKKYKSKKITLNSKKN